jgi:hypothetical protein
LSSEALKSGLLALPFTEAVATGDGYYLVWPENSPVKQNVEILLNWLNRHIPQLPEENLKYLNIDEKKIS